mmetsp:Transcript_2247/g.8087  ORF Transcript_2247/g.8087 Transcript_2247/m.8087 type:complete len:268 (+) Transcript_2247:333-1136(+)
MHVQDPCGSHGVGDGAAALAGGARCGTLCHAPRRAAVAGPNRRRSRARRGPRRPEPRRCRRRRVRHSDGLRRIVARLRPPRRPSAGPLRRGAPPRLARRGAAAASRRVRLRRRLRRKRVGGRGRRSRHRSPTLRRPRPRSHAARPAAAQPPRAPPRRPRGRRRVALRGRSGGAQPRGGCRGARRGRTAPPRRRRGRRRLVCARGRVMCLITSSSIHIAVWARTHTHRRRYAAHGSGDGAAARRWAWLVLYHVYYRMSHRPPKPIAPE